MARIRSIKPEIWTDERLTECSVSARLLFIGMLNFADDNGNQVYSAKRMKMQIFPADNIDTQPLIDELIAHGVVIEYSVNGDKYLNIKGFKKHQVINRPSKTSIPEPDCTESALSTHGALSDGREGKGREEEEKPSSSATPINAPKAVDLQQAKVERLVQVTDEAIAAFNASELVKGNGPGLLARVSPTVGREKRQQQVRRGLRTIRSICAELYASQTITPEFWRDYWATVAADDFHAGRGKPGRGHENWLPDFEFLTREETILKVYDRAAEEHAA